MSYDWPVKNAIVDLPSKMKGNSKCSESVEGRNKDIGPASQSLRFRLLEGFNIHMYSMWAIRKSEPTSVT